jgi:predicted nuclease of predicted toxin-antitoxin system
MRLLLDESVNFRLNRLLQGHDIKTTKQMGWDSFRNGNLIELARGQFDAMITRDHNIPFQQNLTGSDLAVIVLFSRSNSMSDLAPLAPSVLDALNSIDPGQVIRIYPPDTQ